MTDDDYPDVSAGDPQPVDPLIAWHMAMAGRAEMVLDTFEWQEGSRHPWDAARGFAKPSAIGWTSAKTGTLYRSTLIDGWLKTRAVTPPSDFSADVWLGYNYMSPEDILQAIINRVRDYGHAL